MTIVIHLGSGDSFMEHLGLTNTKKILPIQEDTTGLFLLLLFVVVLSLNPIVSHLLLSSCPLHRERIISHYVKKNG